MKFIQVNREVAVNPESIDYLTRNIDGFAVVHIGIESFQSSFPYESLVNLLSMNTPRPEGNPAGNGPLPTSTALAY